MANMTCCGADILVDNQSSFDSALSTIKSGDVIILKNGRWNDVTLKINKGGEEKSPLLIKAETPGHVIFCGKSSIEYLAPHVTIDGILFTDGFIQGGAVIRFSSHYGKIINSAIIDFNPPDFKTKYYWVYFKGNNNTADCCYFKGKSNSQPLIGNDQDDSRYNTVSNSYFKDIPYVENENGREIFRIWGYGRSEEMGDDGACFSILKNVFDHADGEGVEIISFKSNRNIASDNLILSSRGGIVLRSGNFNVVKNNVILGNGVKGATGIRVSGRNHSVTGNYISNCDNGITVQCGEYIEKDLTGSYDPILREGTPLGRVPRYGPVRKLLVSNNVIVKCKRFALEIGGSYKSRWPVNQMIMLPEDSSFENNRIITINEQSSIIGTTPDQEAPFNTVTFQPNTFSKNIIMGGVNSYKPSFGGCTQSPLPEGWTEDQAFIQGKMSLIKTSGPNWLSPLITKHLLNAK